MSTILDPAERKAATPRPAGADRRPMLDACRLVAAYAIVWLHSPPSADYARWTAPARFAVPFFTAAAVFLAWQSAARGGHSLAGYARSRLLRIYLPFLAWSGIYLAFKAVKALLLPDQANVFPGIEVLWLGSFYHLWFMPFVLVTTLVVFGLGRTVAGRPWRENAALVTALFVGWLIAWWPVDRSQVDVSFAQLCADALPSALWAVAFAIAWLRGASRVIARPAAGWFSLAAAVALVAIVAVVQRNGAAENLAGMALLNFALTDWRAPAVERLARFGALAYGIYLCHPLFIKVVESLEAKAGIQDSGGTVIGTFLIASAASTLVAWCLSRSRWTSWLVG